jgi:hypothetical protein
MCIDSSTTPDTPTTAASPNDSIQAPDAYESPPLSYSNARKRRSESPYRPDHPHQQPQCLQESFWTSAIRNLPVYHCSPWNFHVQFLKLEPWKEMQLVLCNKGTEIRAIREAPLATGNGTGPIISEIQHQNFIDLYGLYCFGDRGYLVLEYVPFSLKEILQNQIYPTELEIAYIIGQVNRPSSF